MPPPSLMGILLLLPAAAIAADRLLLLRHKRTLHDAAVKYWCLLDEIPAPDIPKLLGRFVIRYWDKILNSKKKAILAYLFTSAVFTCLPFILNSDLKEFSEVNGDIFDKIPLPHVLVLTTIMAFNIATIMLIRRLLIQVQIRNAILSIIGIFDYIILLSFLMMLCMAVTRYENDLLISKNALGLRADQRILAIQEFQFITNSLYENTLAGPKETAAIVRSNIDQVVALASRNARNLRPSKTIATEHQQGFEQTVAERVHVSYDNTFYFDLTQSVMAFLYVFSNKTHGEFHWANFVTTYVNGFPFYRIAFFSVSDQDFISTITLATPTLLLIYIVLFLFISKLLLTFIRRMALYSLELLADKKPIELIPFTLIAAVLDILIVILMVTKHFLK